MLVFSKPASARGLARSRYLQGSVGAADSHNYAKWPNTMQHQRWGLRCALVVSYLFLNFSFLIQVVDAAKKLLALGPESVLVKLGASGSLLIGKLAESNGGAVVREKAKFVPPGKVVDTTGAGDCFTGAPYFAVLLVVLACIHRRFDSSSRCCNNVLGIVAIVDTYYANENPCLSKT